MGWVEVLPGILSVVVGKIRRSRAVEEEEEVMVVVSEILSWGSQLVSWALRS